ncbi:MAG: sigma-70 family RNA polymerase sigma factor [Anaerolineae bacterium]|nr:sigma-70 family RNA polymerase sigma factor [Anaerolineae bacterium]
MTDKNDQDLTSLDDSTLVTIARQDRSAFGVLYERYVKDIYKYNYVRTGNAHDAEDLTSRVFHRALSHIDSYIERGVPFQAWLYRIAHNLVANWHRDRSRHQSVPLEDFVNGLREEAPESTAEAVDEKDRLLEAMRKLPEDRQQLVLLKFVEKKSNQEIGEIMGKSEGAIKSLYHRTLLSLRDLLNGLSLDPDDPDLQEEVARPKS